MKIFTYVMGVTLIVFMSGCYSKGSVNNPYKPKGYKTLPTFSKNSKQKETATVYVYRSSELFGISNIGFNPVVIDDKIDNPDNDDINLVMGAHRSGYMVKEFKPGLHSFAYGSLLRQGKQTVMLEKGSEYFLAISFNFFGTPTLEFRTKEEFLIETKDEDILYLTGEWNAFSGYEYKILKK